MIVIRVNLKPLNPEEIRMFDNKLHERIPSLVSWSYSYLTNEFILELSDHIDEKEAKAIVESVIKELFG